MKYQVLVHNPFRNLKNNARWLKWLMNFNARRFTLTTPPFAGKFEPNYFFDFKQLIVNLSGQILENSSKNFPKFQFFEAWHRPISGKLIHCFEFSISAAVILENFSIFGWVFQKSVCVTPRKNWNFGKFLDEFSRICPEGLTIDCLKSKK